MRDRGTAASKETFVPPLPERLVELLLRAIFTPTHHYTSAWGSDCDKFFIGHSFGPQDFQTNRCRASRASMDCVPRYYQRHYESKRFR